MTPTSTKHTEVIVFPGFHFILEPQVCKRVRCGVNASQQKTLPTEEAKKLSVQYMLVSGLPKSNPAIMRSERGALELSSLHGGT